MTALQLADLEEVIDQVPGHDILTAGFPCQPFSSAGKKGGLTDPRSDTIASLLTVITRREPAAVVLENVPFILAAREGKPFVSLVRALDDLGYSVSWRVVNAADFGLPQYRPRVLVIASRGGGVPSLRHDDEALSPQEGPARSKLRPPAWGYLERGTVWCLSERPMWRDWSEVHLHDWLDEHVAPAYDFTSETLRRLPESVAVGRSIRGVEVLYNQSGGSRMGYTVYGTAGLAPTLTATTSRHYERFAIGASFRRLTPEEYARLQGFPDVHCSAAPHAERYVLCGNAIAPPMAQWALERALASLDIQATWTVAA